MFFDFSEQTVFGLKDLAKKHNFMFVEDRKFVDISQTVQQQQHNGGALKISEFAYVVNASGFAGEGIVDALEQGMTATEYPHKNERAMLILAEMTMAELLPTGDYTSSCFEIARKHKSSVIGFVAAQALNNFEVSVAKRDEDEDFVIFTTRVNAATKGDSLGQQYQTPSSAIFRGSDFIIVVRGVYAAVDPIKAVRQYKKEGWEAYLKRIRQD